MGQKPLYTGLEESALVGAVAAMRQGHILTSGALLDDLRRMASVEGEQSAGPVQALKSALAKLATEPAEVLTAVVLGKAVWQQVVETDDERVAALLLLEGRPPE